ncbi:ferritin [Candidatus Woesearchaeota archaeon]|nr:ferritin [Candidatus Woesearchaeota archaeon]
MGTKGIEIVGMDVKVLIELLNKALADEWLAYYQYWVGAKIVKGPMRSNVEAELKEHAEEEFKHANMLADRIVQLGGTPILNPKVMGGISNCGYDEPTDPHVMKILEQNIKGEQCAIATYSNMLKKIKFADDPISANMIRKIMEDEVEHEEDLQAIKEDIEMMKKA